MNLTPPRNYHALFATASLIAGLSLSARAALPPQPLSGNAGRLNHPVLFVPGLGGSPEHFGMDKAEPTCTDPDWTGTKQRIDKRPITIKDKNGKDFVIGYNHWLVIDVEAVCNGGIRVPYHAESKAWVSAIVYPINYPITYERDGAVIKAGSASFDVDETVRAFEGRYIRELAPTAEIDHWRNFLRATDRVETFRDRSAPQLLASYFALNTPFDREEFGPRDRWWYDPGTRRIIRPGEGINKNGLHVFQPKTWQTTSQVCQDPEAELIAAIGGRVVRTFTMPGPLEQEVVRLQFALRCHGILNPSVLRNLYLPFDEEGGFGDIFESDQPDVRVKHLLRDADIEEFYPSDRAVTSQLLANPNTIRIGYRRKNHVLDYSGAADGLAYPLVPLYLPSEEVPPTWTGQGMDGGQADQLLIKMKDVLDEFYGVGQWWNNPNAQIDLVSHSQGALVIREMIANNRLAVPANPISHIRQILAITSPLHGTALATDNTVLRSPASALDADLGQKPFPELAALRDGLKLRTVSTPTGDVNVPGYDCSSSALGSSVPAGCLDIKADLSLNAKEIISSTVMGPLLSQYNTYTILMSLSGPWLGPYSIHASGLGITVSDKNGIDLPIRQTLADAAKDGSYLGWPQSSEYIDNLVGNPANRDAPKYPGTEDFIPFTTLSSGSVGSFIQEAVWGVSEALREACPVGDNFWQGKADVLGVTLGRAWVTCSSFRNTVSQLESQFAAQLSPIDEGWSKQGDMVVDLGSQRAYRPSLDGWSRASTFSNKSFAYNPYVMHGPFKIKQTFDISGSGVRLNPLPLNADFSGSSMQGCDILDQLGVTGYEKIACLEPEKTGFRNVLRSKSLFQLKPSYLIAGGSPSSGQLLARVQNTGSGSVSGLQIDIPVHTDVQGLPTARLAGITGASVAMVPVAKGAWIARIRTPSTLAPSSYWPNENGFQLEVTDPMGLPVRIALDDSAEDWTGSVEAVVRSSQGSILSGIDPVPALRIYSEQVATSPSVEVIAAGYQSRGSDMAWTKPVLLLSNEGDRRLENFDVFYRVHAREDGSKPLISLWNVPYGVATGSAEVVADGDSGWVAVIHLRGAAFLPGQELRDLMFGLHWSDWAAWDVSRDASDPGIGSLDISLAVVDVDAIEAMGALPEEPVDPGTWMVEGFDEGLSDPKTLKPRLRVTNKGSTSSEGFTLRVPFTAPTGISPILETWYVPGCSGAMEGSGAGRTVVYVCPNVRVPAGGVWPDASGLVFGLRDANWMPWPRGGDALTRELGGSWKVVTTPEVVR